MKDGHANFSPSGLQRTLECPGSHVLAANEPDIENDSAKQGTLAHALAAYCLENGLEPKDVTLLPTEGKDGKPLEVPISAEMREYVNEAVDYIRERAVGHSMLIEQKLDLEPLTGEKDARGTADVILISDDGSAIRVFDFKFGYNEVKAENNAQVRAYSLCAADVFSPLGNFTTYENGIVQTTIGNIDSEVVPHDEMLAYAQKIRTGVARAREAMKSNSLDGYLKTGPHCRYCRAAYKCPKLVAEVQEVTLVDFEDETQRQLPEPLDLAKAGAKLELVEIWPRSVRAKIEAELFAGREVRGWKLVEGKKGNRVFVDEETTVTELTKLGVKKSDITTTKLLTPAQLEKKIKGNQAALDKLPALYSQAPGRPGVAPLSDKRPPYRLKPEDDFSEVVDD